jgi:phage FluMu protein Com
MEYHKAQQPETVRCFWCGRELAEVRGGSHLRVRCGDCSRMTYYEKDARKLDKPQDIVVVKA